MSIVINSNPGTYYSAHGDLIFTVYESVKANDPVTYVDYKYIADIYVDAVLVARLKSVPRPDNKRGIFNIGSIVRNYLSAEFNPASGTRSQQLGDGEFFVSVQVKFGEEYNFTLYTNLVTDSTRVYYNHYNGRLLGTSTALAIKADKALSNRPYQNYVSLGDSYYFIPYLPSDTDSITVRVRTYDYSGSLAVTFDQSFTPSGANVLQQFNIGPVSLNAAYGSALLSNFIQYYTVEFITPNASPDSIYRFDLTCDAIYDNITLHFFNQYGGFESKDFSKVSRKMIEIEKTSFGKLPYTIDGSGNVSYTNGNVYNETNSTYASQYTEKMILNTDNLSDGEYAWLGELIISPLVYLERAGYFISVSVSDKNYEYRLNRNDKITNMTLNIEFGDQFNSQYR